MALAIFIGRILGLLRDTVLTSHFGARLDADSYRIAFAVPDTIFMLVAGGGLSSAFIPVFGEFFAKGKQKEAWAAFSVVVTVCSLAAAALIGTAWVFAPQIVALFAAGKDPSTLPRLMRMSTHMSRILLPAQFAFLIGSILIATLYVQRKFWVGGLAPNIYNLFTVLGGMLLPALLHMGVESMAWGALAGAMVGNLLLPVCAVIANRARFRPSLALRTEGVDRFFKLLLPVVFGFSLPSMVTLITTKAASAYGAAGVNTVLNLSNNLMQAPLGIFGQALALGVFPILAQFVALNRMDLYRKQISKTLRTVLYLGIPAGALMLALAPQIVHSLYGYGLLARDPAAQNSITDCLRLYTFGVFAWCMQPVLMRGFFSLHKTFKPIAVSTLITGIFILLCVIAIHFSNDFRLIPVATDVSVVILSGSLYFALERDVGKLDRGGIAATILLCGLASALAAGVCFGAMQLLHPVKKLAEIALLIGVGVLGMWIYYFATSLMRVPETEYVDRVVGRMRGRFLSG